MRVIVGLVLVAQVGLSEQVMAVLSRMAQEVLSTVAMAVLAITEYEVRQHPTKHSIPYSLLVVQMEGPLVEVLLSVAAPLATLSQLTKPAILFTQV